MRAEPEESTRSVRVKSVFQDVVERPETEWAGLLAQHCGDDDDLRARVHALLGAHRRAEALLPEFAALGGNGLPIQAAVALAPGDHVGPFRLLRVLGEGGFGVVFLAAQEQPIRRHVALKVIRLGMDTRQVIARFEAERQALALMDHPGIARVLDAGTTDRGRPYFVMEYVQGERITQFCDDRSLDLRQRLALFEQVCLAVQHAHHKGVIHRDLKPGNVLVSMVDGRPLPKVIDFGVAKATGRRLVDATVTVTREDQMVGTPEFMSPEQTSAEDTDTRSDVYSLGVLLYHLLVGVSPYDDPRLPRAHPAEWIRVIREVDPPRPSLRMRRLGEGAAAVARARATNPERLARDLTGELDWIVGRAIEKDRARRYATAYALAADVRRFLVHEPVEAGPPSHLYRVRKLCRRHRGAAAMLAVTAVACIITVWSSVASAVSSRAAQAEAERRRNELEEQAYTANVYAAAGALSAHDVVEVERRLQMTAPRLRGFEWQLLATSRDRSVATYAAEGKALAVAFHPDGETLLCPWLDGGVRVLSTGGELLATTVVPTEQIRQAAWSAAGDVALAVTASGKLVRWAWRRGGTDVLAAHGDCIDVIAVAGELVATGSRDHSAAIWTADGTTLIRRLPHDAPVHWVEFSNDGRLLVTASWDQLFTVWDVATGQRLLSDCAARTQTTREPARRFALAETSVARFAPRGNLLATGNRDGLVTLWDTAAAARVAVLDLHQPGVRDLAFNQDGTRLAVAARDNLASLWDTASGKLIGRMEHDDDVRTVAFHPDGEMLATASFDRAVRLWDSRRCTLAGVLLGHEDTVDGVHFSPDGRQMVSYGGDGRVKSWCPRACREAIANDGSFVLDLAFTVRDELLCADGWHGASLLRLDGATPTRVPVFRADHVISVAVAADSSLLALGTITGKIVLCDATGQELDVVDAHRGQITQLAFSPREGLLLSTSWDQSAALWEVPSLHLRRRLLGHTGKLSGATFAASGTRVVTVDQAGTMRRWDTASSVDDDIVLALPQGGFESVAVHPDGRRLAAGTDRRSIVLVDLDGTRREADLHGHGGAVTALGWLPDASRLASVSNDRTLRLWDVARRECVVALRGHSRFVHSLAIAPDGKSLATGSEDSTVRLWRLRH